MFTAIAPSYDRLNRIISFRFDLRWRRAAVARLGWERAPAGRYLDLCAGTLDFAAILSRQSGFRGRITGADFVQPMLRLGRNKAPGLQPVTADALQLPFPDATFDGAMVGWGLRNLMDLEAGLREAARVLKPGARLVALETCHPPRQPLRGLYNFYFERVLPRVGRFFSKHTDAYSWLPESARYFPEPAALSDLLRRCGFARVEHRLLLGGATALHMAERGEGRGERGEVGTGTVAAPA
jgi:demethylmenaquinone methyltransferase/2-methoxy-6-polyprenyl-1,4-benzoquinol methylase